ncbi:hypothetical protein GCM10027184_17380 [Saccharothrix stipae]
MSRVRSWATFLAVVTLAASGLVGMAGSSRADIEQQNCTGTWSVNYDPPITNTPTTTNVKVTGYFFTCTNLLAPSGAYEQTFTDTVSCTQLLVSGATSRTYRWSNPAVEPSTFSYNWTVTRTGGQTVITNSGLIASGTFASASAQQVTTLVTPDSLQCAGTGVSSLTGLSTLVVLGL